MVNVVPSFNHDRVDAKAGNCDNGRHEIKSTAGASVQAINTVVVLPNPK